MAKKPSAKQLAARRKFAKIMKSGGFKKKKSKSKTKSKSKSTRTRVRVITKVRKVRTMARRRTSRRSKSSSKGIMSTVKRFAKPIAIGLGTSAVLGLGAGAIGQPGLAQNKLINAGAAFVLGGPVAGGAALLLGGGGNLFGNGGGQQGI